MKKRSISVVGLAMLLFSCKQPSNFKALVLAQLEFNRQATNRLLDDIEKTGHAREALLWRAGPGRAPLGWQFMHVAASEDRLGARTFASKTLVSEALAEEFKSGKPAGDRVPEMAEVRKYLNETRSALEKSIADFDLSRLDEKPAPDARSNFRSLFQLLMWHEAHHEGEARATFNLFKAAHNIKDPDPGK